MQHKVAQAQGLGNTLPPAVGPLSLGILVLGYPDR